MVLMSPINDLAQNVIIWTTSNINVDPEKPTIMTFLVLHPNETFGCPNVFKMKIFHFGRTF